ncbi:uncharacterized protein [Palaemon carinicauda]|uniref:uncharacterized protein n=1 Tax=Palaemon carinicauda TaxID=392227 RepID=UPI0035B5EE01
MAHRLLTAAKRLERLLLKGKKLPPFDPESVGKHLAKIEGPYSSVLLQQWYLFCEKPPRGFEKYFRGTTKKSQSSSTPKQTIKDAPQQARQASSKAPSSKDPFSMSIFGSGNKVFLKGEDFTTSFSLGVFLVGEEHPTSFSLGVFPKSEELPTSFSCGFPQSEELTTSFSLWSFPEIEELPTYFSLGGFPQS